MLITLTIAYDSILLINLTFMNHLLGNKELIALIFDEIKERGAIDFARFMHLALYTPHGFYCNDGIKFGASGHYTTAPLISPLFAKAIANQFQQIKETLPKSGILEWGAGNGYFAKDVLLQLEKLNALPSHYIIIEISPNLQNAQYTLLKEHCPHLLPYVTWSQVLPKTTFQGLIFANEVLDAFPFHCFQLEKEKMYERYVTLKDNELTFELRPAQGIVKDAILQLKKEIIFPSLYASEINLHYKDWMYQCANFLNKGVLLIIDYGYKAADYYHPLRTNGTLTCFYQHTKHTNPLIHLGYQDITAHVNFTAILKEALFNHLTLLGFSNQASFLLSLDILHLKDHKKMASLENYKENQAIKTLLAPDEMGETIKVLALGKDFSLPLQGFRLQK